MPTSTAAASWRRATSSTTRPTGSSRRSRGSIPTSSTSPHWPVGLERRPSAVGRQGGAGARAQDLQRARQEPELVEDDARDHVRRARRLLRSRAAARAQDDKAAFRTYGVRVPAIVVSPFTPRASVSNVVFDHTSIIKTVLLRFCASGGQIPDMGARV
ncbi:MAG: hypothetical protein E6G45_07375 [Actinobacteria bacterium]|nr:MAG: hypothetical protein E6G45_07375 [Actinomycetota bacterium]